MADVISDAFSPIGNAFKGGGGSVSSGISGGLLWGIGIFVGIAVIAIIGALIWWYYYDKKQWNIVTRVHYENPAIDGITIGNGVPTKRLRFKDGRVVYLYKSPIQGYSISPELLTWTRPREHDVIVTQDKKLFCLIGILGIDVERKKLKVDVSYPDIEMDRQDLQHFIDSKNVNDPNQKLKIIAKVAVWIFIMVTIIVVAVIAGKTYTETKAIDLERDRINLEISDSQTKVMDNVNTFIAILKETMPESFAKIDGQVLVGNTTG